MIQWLTYIGLAVIPFVIVNGGGRYPKEVVAIGIAAAIGFIALNQGLLKAINNKFLFITLFFMLAGTAFVPPSGVALGLRQNDTIVIDNRLDVDNLWNYKPILYAIVFLIMICALSSIEIGNMDDYFKIMAWCGLITSVIAIVQHFGFTQFWNVKPTSEIGSTLNPEMMSFIGHPTTTAAFICLCILPALYIRQYSMVLIMGLAVWMTGSDFGKLGLIASIIFWSTQKHLFLFLGAIALIILIAFMMLFVFHLEPNGRLSVWIQAINDLRRPVGPSGMQYAFTGYGAGAYHYANQLMHHSPWGQAHNEFIEFMFNNGVIGLMLLLSAIGIFITQCIRNFYDPDVYILLCIFLVASIIACGTFIWQLAVGQFYTVTVLGLAYNRLREK